MTTDKKTLSRSHHPPISPHISGILLAAGASQRMGRPKLLLPWKSGTIIEQVIDTYLRSILAELVVVIGAHADEVRMLVSPKAAVVVENYRYEEGMSTSIRCGVQAASPAADAYLIALADQPLITADAVDCLVQAFAAEKPLIAAAAYQGRRGHPVVFDRALHQELCTLQGDEGGKRLIGKYARQVLYVELGSSAVFTDIDTPEDYDKVVPR